MPDAPSPKHIAHPGKQATLSDAPVVFADEAYAELHVTTNFTFLTGASHPEELVRRAADLGHRGIAITDRNSLAGVVRAHAAAKALRMPLAVGCHLWFTANDCNVDLLVYPTHRRAYGQLCELLTLGKRRASKGECHLTLHDVLDHHAGLLGILLPPAMPAAECWLEAARGLRDAFDDDRFSLAASFAYSSDDQGRLDQLAHLAAHLQAPLVASNDVHYHIPDRKPLHDVLACIRTGTTLEQAGFTLSPNAEQYIKPAHEMHRLFAAYPHAIARSVDILHRAAGPVATSPSCRGFSLDELRYEYPHETCPPGKTAMRHLTDLTWAGAEERFPQGVSDDVRRKIEYELALIDELNYPHYFLTVHDIVAFARSRGILCQGRGAAANSAVCYCLGVTAVNPAVIDLLFERFISKERDEPPDIDIDFEHERREEVIQSLYAKYGRHRAALTAEVITYRGRSAVRDVGKALGLSLDLVDRLAKDLFWFDTEVTPRSDPRRYRDLGVDPRDPTMILLGQLSREILGFPRHLSQHVGGFVLTEQPLSSTVPIENAAMADRTVIEWDKDDIDTLGMLKVDVLGLGMLTCIRKCFELIEQHHGRSLAMHTVPVEDPGVYEMVSNADTVGVFQIESRAQMSMLPRLRPNKFYDLVIEVAIVRPGPIQGGMVHPYLRRRNGEEEVTYPSEAVRRVLQKTLGVPLFQEQAMQLAIKAAGFTPGEADQLRRSMAAWKRKGNLLAQFGEKIITGMLANGYERDFAERCFEQIKGFSEYGFPESHAASFALLVYVSAWLKCYYPAAFAAALLNSQPMGFYAPAQLVRDAKDHRVTVREVDALHSAWDCTLEPMEDGRHALRLGMRMVKGMREPEANAITQAASGTHITTIEQLWRRSNVSARALRSLASADAFTSLGLTRQQARWATQQLHDIDMPLFEQRDEAMEDDAHVALPPVAAPLQVVQDYQHLGLSLKAHPLSFLRRSLDRLRVTPCHELLDETRCPHGLRVRVAGLVLVRQRPSTASGITFMTLEDDTGIANLIVRPHIFDRYRKAARHSQIILAHGTIERQGQVVHVMARAIFEAPSIAGEHRVKARDFH